MRIKDQIRENEGSSKHWVCWLYLCHPEIPGLLMTVKFNRFHIFRGERYHQKSYVGDLLFVLVDKPLIKPQMIDTSTVMDQVVD